MGSAEVWRWALVESVLHGAPLHCCDQNPAAAQSRIAFANGVKPRLRGWRFCQSRSRD